MRKDDGSVEATVGPAEVSKDDILAGINSTTSIVSITTDLMKKVSIIEHEPEMRQTDYGVVGDLLGVLENAVKKK